MGPEVGLAALQFGGSLAQGIGQYGAGAAEREAGRMAKEQAEINARMLETLGVRAAHDVRAQARRVASTRTVAYARGGVNPMSGSALDVALDAVVEDELAALDAKFGFDSRAFQERVRGHSASEIGKIRQSQAQARGIQTIISGAASAGHILQLFPDKADFDAPGDTTAGVGTVLAPARASRQGAGTVLRID